MGAASLLSTLFAAAAASEADFVGVSVSVDASSHRSGGASERSVVERPIQKRSGGEGSVSRRRARSGEGERGGFLAPWYDLDSGDRGGDHSDADPRFGPLRDRRRITARRGVEMDPGGGSIVRREGGDDQGGVVWTLRWRRTNVYDFRENEDIAERSDDVEDEAEKRTGRYEYKTNDDSETDFPIMSPSSRPTLTPTMWLIPGLMPTPLQKPALTLTLTPTSTPILLPIPIFKPTRWPTPEPTLWTTQKPTLKPYPEWTPKPTPKPYLK